MSAIDTVFKLLTEDVALKDMLGSHALAPEYPAIYDTWALDDVPMPYMVLNYAFDRGDHFAKFSNRVIMDIFTEGNSTRQAEMIRDRLLEIFTHRVIRSEGEGPIRFYYLRDGSVPEEEDDVVHWSIEFQFIYWNESLINAVNSR